MSHRPRSLQGITLLEVMITVAIIGILGAIALPTYRSYRLTAARHIAIECLYEAHNRAERFFARNGRYPVSPPGVLTQFDYPDDPHVCDEEGLYQLTIEIDGNQQRYQLRATALGRQLPDGRLVLVVYPGKTNPNERLVKVHETPDGQSLAGWEFQPGK